MQPTKIKFVTPEETFNAKFLPFVLGEQETNKPLCVFEGGRGSGKSRAVVQSLVIRAMKNKLRIALVRKVADTIRDSIYREIQDTVKEWNLESLFKFISSPLEIRVQNGSEFICKGLDKNEKIKSLANVDIVVVEEATELTKDDWLTLALTIRGQSDAGTKQKILIFNREDGNWTEQEFFNADGSFIPREDVYHNHSTFTDNKFLDGPFLASLEKLRTADEDAYRKHALGLPVKLKGIIYENWDIVDGIPENAHDKFAGIDFGFIEPCVFLQMHRRENEIWIEEKLYQTHLTNTQFIERMKTFCPMNMEIAADSAEPKAIQEIYDAGFYGIAGAIKGADSVKHGTDTVNRYRLHILSSAVNTIKEIKSYKRKIDKAGNILEDPIDFNDHAMSALRYGISTHLMQMSGGLEVAFEI